MQTKNQRIERNVDVQANTKCCSGSDERFVSSTLRWIAYKHKIYLRFYL